MDGNYIPEIIYKKFIPHGKYKFRRNFASEKDAKNFVAEAMDAFVQKNGPITIPGDWNKACDFFRNNY